MFNRHRIVAFGAIASVLLIAAPLASAAKAPTPDDPTAVLNSFKQGPYARIGPFLGNLYEEYQAAGSSHGHGAKAASFRSRDPLIHVKDGMVSVDMLASDAAALKRSLHALGAAGIKSRGPLFSARVPVKSLGALAALTSLDSARPVLATTNALPALAHSQGDETMNADVARSTFGVSGAGVPVGILSDSFACNPGPFYPGTPSSTYEQDKASGELPQDVTILEDACPGGTDEGRAMGQIVHDVAPGSPLMFYTAWNGQLDFALGIMTLANEGAKVITDDVGYFAEPMFSDGMIAQAVDYATAHGAAYFSSAGNQARDSYESPFRPVHILTNAGKNLNGGKAVVRTFHDFDPGSGVSILQPVAVYPSGGAGFVVMSFQWDQPFLSATTFARVLAGQDPGLAKGAESDLDLVFFDYKGHVIRACPPGVARGITCQITGDRNIGGDAVDIAALYYAGPPKTPMLFYIGLVLNGGPAPGHVKYSTFVEQGAFAPLAFDTQSGTTWGHPNSATGQAVGAATWYATVPWSTSGTVPANDIYNPPPIDMSPCNPGCLNDFSSAGNVPIYLDKFGNYLGTPERRYQPSVTGPDGGNSSFFYSDSSYDDDDGNGLNSPFSTFVTPLDEPGNEFPNFFGTSAAAPHVAAVAALMLERDPALTPAMIRTILEDTARPISLRFTSNRPLDTWAITPGPDGYNDDAGHGLVDAEAAVSEASPPPP